MPVTFTKSNTIKDDGRSGSAGASGKASHRDGACWAPRGWKARRRPEDTALYQLVQEHLETFLAQVERETGSGLPEFVKDEFNAFLECGILAHSFLRLRCADCAHEKLVAFSCKRRGFCPSCGARRMAETAAHLIDHVIPRVPVRQWVLSFPIPLRLLFATHPQLLAPVMQIVHRVIATFLIQQMGLQRTEAKTGAVTLIQRFGSAANLNIHLHCLMLNGVYRTTEGLPVFHTVHAPTATELQALLNRIIKRNGLIPAATPSHQVPLPEPTAPFGLLSRERPKRPGSGRLAPMNRPKNPRSWTDGSRT